MRKFRWLLVAVVVSSSIVVSGASEADASGCCIPALANIHVTAPNANTTIVITGNNVIASQHLSVWWDGQLLSPSCSGPTSTAYGELWSCSTVTDWYVTLGNATNLVDADQSGSAFVHVYGNLGQDTVHTKNGHGDDTIDCGAYDHVKDWIYKNTNDTASHCSSGNDRVGT